MGETFTSLYIYSLRGTRYVNGPNVNFEIQFVLLASAKVKPMLQLIPPLLILIAPF